MPARVSIGKLLRCESARPEVAAPRTASVEGVELLFWDRLSPSSCTAATITRYQDVPKEKEVGEGRHALRLLAGTSFAGQGRSDLSERDGRCAIRRCKGGTERPR